ncbi:MAG: 4-hydroxy-tetrahydrodipicolinate synthase [Clostridia bacterium]|nr:4-hydroxy-tetrahydrodipicolinate synthase [Clostridia bacterium]
MSKNKKSIFKGAATAIATPFRDGEVDYIALGRLIDFQIESGIDALVVCGTTGESATLSDREHREVLSFALEKVDGRVPMIAGTGSNDTAHAVETSKFASRLGYDALLCVTPYYNKATEQGLIKSFTAIAEASDKPIILYNVPTRTCTNITLPVYRELSRHENIVAVKEASGNVSAIAKLICECGDDFDVYSGNDDQTLPLLSLGGAGVISVVSNLIPHEMSMLCRAWFEGNISAARKVHEKYLSLMNLMFCEVNPIPVKTALALMEMCREEFRLPMCSPEDTTREKLRDALNNHELLK